MFALKGAADCGVRDDAACRRDLGEGAAREDEQGSEGANRFHSPVPLCADPELFAFLRSSGPGPLARREPHKRAHAPVADQVAVG